MEISKASSVNGTNFTSEIRQKTRKTKTSPEIKNGKKELLLTLAGISVMTAAGVIFQKKSNIETDKMIETGKSMVENAQQSIQNIKKSEEVIRFQEKSSHRVEDVKKELEKLEKETLKIFERLAKNQ